MNHIAALLVVLVCAAVLPAARAEEPRYVTLTFHWIERDMPADTDLRAKVEELREAFGAQPPDSPRHVGFSPGLIHTVNLPVEVLKERVNLALDTAELTGMPVFFHFDEMHFWWNRNDLHEDPMNVEWSDFPAEGEIHGPVISRYWLNWGSWLIFPAPPPCFESPAIRADMAFRLRECIAAPITARLSKWREEGKEYLFAGIATGNESEVIPDMRPLASSIPKGSEPEGVDITKHPPTRLTMRRDEMVRGGYAALHYLGHNRASIATLAKESGETHDEVVTRLLKDVARDYATFRSKVLYEAGIPRERIYTHFISPFRPFIAAMVGQRPPDIQGPTMLDRFPPVASAVNPYSRPGFTVVRRMVNLSDLTSKIEGAAGMGARALGWAGVETYPSTAQPGRKQTQEEFEEYLGGLFAHGARVWNVYVWDSFEPVVQDSPFIVKKNPAVIKAIRNWVQGKELPSDWSGTPLPSEGGGGAEIPEELQAKMRKAMQTVQRYVAQGGNPQEIQTLAEKAGEFIQQEEYEEATKLFDQILAISGDTSATPPSE